MATYYRWRQSNIEYTPVEGPELIVQGTNYFQFTNNIGQDSAYTYNYGSGYSVESNEDLALTDTRSEDLYFCVSAYTIIKSDGDVAYIRTPELDSKSLYKCKPYLNGSEGYVIVIRKNSSSSSANINAGSVKEFTVEPSKGTSIGYVYSTSSSAYPNGGVSGSYYYDQRTTVTSPTAPTGLTYPNPITTPTVTVSWNAATSNTDYPVDHYFVIILPNNVPSMLSYTTTSTTQEISIPLTYNNIPVTTVTIRVIALDTNGQRSSYYDTSNIPVYFAPTLTVPQMVMQGQSATISWSAIDGADSYTLQRKANTDADWTQVYSGANLSYSETVGTWTSVQYRVQAVFSGTPGGWAESAAIPVVSSSALVISGTDGDLGTVVNDIPYSISTDTGNQITATITVNSAVIFSGNVGNSTSDTIPVLDLVNGEGTIVIEASVQASGGPVSAVRTWTYTKSLITFPNAGSVAQLTKEGENIFPKTLAECVRLPGGGTLDQVMGFPAQVYTASYTGTGTYGASNPTQISFPFVPDLWGIVTTGGQGPANLFPWGTTSIYGWTNTGYINATCSYSDKTVSISGASAVAQANSSNLEHCFIGIKVGTEAEE